jgi:hypothetical protein
MFRQKFWMFLIAAMLIASLPHVYGQTATTRPPRRVQQEDAPLFPNLTQGLLKTNGCLGVESARTESGKNVIFAWFKDKQSALEWYHSDMHQEVMKKFFPNRDYRDPLEGVPDDSGPIMAIASITFSDNPQLGGSQLPASQIAIELYAPLTGGLSIGGKFAPDSLQVDGLKDYSESKGK